MQFDGMFEMFGIRFIRDFTVARGFKKTALKTPHFRKQNREQTKVSEWFKNVRTIFGTTCDRLFRAGEKAPHLRFKSRRTGKTIARINAGASVHIEEFSTCFFDQDFERCQIPGLRSWL